MMPLISNARMFAIRKSLLRGRHRCYERLRDGAGPTRIRLSPPLPLMIFWSLVIAGLENAETGPRLTLRLDDTKCPIKS
jgi:hypothetical protein